MAVPSDNLIEAQRIVRRSYISLPLTLTVAINPRSMGLITTDDHQFIFMDARQIAIIRAVLYSRHEQDKGARASKQAHPSRGATCSTQEDRASLTVDASKQAHPQWGSLVLLIIGVLEVSLLNKKTFEPSLAFPLTIM